MKNIESLDEPLTASAEFVEDKPAEPSVPKSSAKPKTKKAKVVSYDKVLNIVVYEVDGATYQSNCVKYDGVSEYIEI